MRSKLPNVLSLSRIAFSFIIVLISSPLTLLSYLVTIAIVVIVLITDVADGYFARRWKVTTELGYILDSLGDRAAHLALILVFLVRYDFHPLFAWLLIFRDIVIFALRVLSDGWLKKSVKIQWISRLHATILRIWLGLFIVRDGFRVFARTDVLGTVPFEVAQMTLLWATIILSYYGLSKSVGWLIDYDHKTLS